MSLKGDKYEGVEEVKFRLENTVVMYDGEPVYIKRVKMPGQDDAKEIARVFFEPLPMKREGRGQPDVRKYLSSRKFDLTPFKMGYANYKGQAVFLSRAPVRQNRQGLSAKNCMIKSLVHNPHRRQPEFNLLVYDQCFVDMVKGKYPSFAEAGEMLDDPKVSSVAVSRSFAFIIDHDLEALMLTHKGTKCGIALRDQNKLTIPAKFHFLKEEMEECRIPIN